MSERFSQIFTCQANLGVENTPVIIKAGALLLDNQTKKIIAQFRMQNISDKEISLVKIKITPQDSIQRDLEGNIVHEYLDLHYHFKEEFGQKKPIYIANPATRAFKVAICEVAFSDGTVWTNDLDSWSPLDNDSTTVKRFIAALAFQEALKYQNEDTIAKLEEAIKLFESAAEFNNVEEIIANCKNRISELTAKAEQETKEKQEKAKKANKIAAIIIPCVAVIIIITLFIALFIVPNTKYNKARNLVDEGKMIDAVELFYDIYDFKDSALQINSIQNIAVKNANTAYLSGDCGTALDILESVKYTGREYDMYYAINNQDYSYAIKMGLTSFIIPNGTTNILNNAFQDCTELVKVKIPDSVTSIGSSAFKNCTKLSSIEIPKKVTSIGDNAFSGCTNLKAIVIPDNVKTLGNSIFSECSNLTSVTISNNITSIPSYAFYECENLTSISIPENVTDIFRNAFSSCKSLTEIKLPNKLKYIGSYAFSNCTGIEKIIIPLSVNDIDSDAFKGCDSLTIFCEASSRPSYWANSSYSSWNSSNRPVIWGSTGEEYTYTFETNGGTAVSDITSYGKINLPSTTRSGMVFMGWYDNTEFSGNAISSTYYSSTKHKLYAKWITEEEFIASCDGTSFEKALLLKLDVELSGNITVSDKDVYFRFTPTSTTSYTVTATDVATGTYYVTSDRLYLYIYKDANGSYTEKAYGYNPSITCELAAGHTYYIKVSPYSYSATGKFNIKIS